MSIPTQLSQLRDADTNRFRPDKGFQGAEAGERAGPRDAPVQFERGDVASNKNRDTYDREDRQPRRREYEEDGDDPFGIGDIVDRRRNTSRGAEREEDTDHVSDRQSARGDRSDRGRDVGRRDANDSYSGGGGRQRDRARDRAEDDEYDRGRDRRRESYEDHDARDRSKRSRYD